jgi:hypothetical protein
LLPLPAAPFTAAGGIVLRLLLVGRVDPVELAQQSRPFELGWFITAADGAVMGGADDLVGDRVEGGARLLEGQLHRAGPLHAIGGHKGRGDAGADDQQTVVAQDQDVAMTGQPAVGN